MTIALPQQQYRIAAFIRDYIADQGWPPTQREIADAMGVAGLNGVHQQLCRLVIKGVIERLPRGSRAIRIVREFGPDDGRRRTGRCPDCGMRAQIRTSGRLGMHAGCNRGGQEPEEEQCDVR